LLDVTAYRIGRLEVVEQHLPIAQDHRKDIVEVVRHSAGEATDGFHLLRLPELFLTLA